MKLAFTFEWFEAYESLDAPVKRQILSKLKEVSRAVQWPHEALVGKQFKGLFKLRVGDYRLIYRIADRDKIDFLYLGHRREIYH